MKFKQNLLLFFYLIAAVVIGGMIGDLCANVPFLGWLAYARHIGFAAENPFVLDLSVLRLTFGFSVGISVAQIFTVALALFLYSRTKGR